MAAFVEHVSALDAKLWIVSKLADEVTFMVPGCCSCAIQSDPISTNAYTQQHTPLRYRVLSKFGKTSPL